MLYFVFNDNIFHADQLYDIVMENMPPNRKLSYYPYYFYENKFLLCSTELKTADSDMYIQAYRQKQKKQFFRNIYYMCKKKEYMVL